jgi:hypothetical protein
MEMTARRMHVEEDRRQERLEAIATSHKASLEASNKQQLKKVRVQ